jgi:LuxR family transcriptional regulator, maltose regulon positive regulatory protein
LQFALAQGEPPLRGTTNLYLGLSELSHELGDPEAALQHLLRCEALGEQAGLSGWRARLCRFQARVKQTQGDLAGALDLLDEAERHHRRSPVPDVRPLAAVKARVWVAQGRLSDALRWVQEQGLSVDDELSYLREFEHITLARVLLAKSMHHPAEPTIGRAMRLLERLQQAAEAGGRMGSVIEIGLLQALAYQAQGNLALAFVALERTLRLAEPEGYVRIFVDEGLPMARLLSAATTQGIVSDYVTKLLAAFAPVEAKAPPRPGGARDEIESQPLLDHRIEPLIEPLSERELEVLQLIAQGCSNAEISARLFLALSTVKGHNRNIFDKLQVQNRTEAVARARVLRLL